MTVLEVACRCVQMDGLMWLDVGVDSVIVCVCVSFFVRSLSESVAVKRLAQFLTGFALYTFSLLPLEYSLECFSHCQCFFLANICLLISFHLFFPKSCSTITLCDIKITETLTCDWTNCVLCPCSCIGLDHLTC